MKKTITATLFAAAVAITASAALAQSPMQADIPFAFHAGSSTMPAGRYTISRNSSNGGTSIFLLRSEDYKKTVMLLPNSPVISPGAVKPASLVFDCSADECALSQVWSGYSETGHRFVHRPTAREKESKQVAILLTPRSAD